MTKRIDHLCMSFMSNGIIMLENIDDLKDSDLYSRQLKYYGNKFIEELEKKILPVEAYLHKDEEEAKQIQFIQTLYEDIFKELSDININQLPDALGLIRALKAGEIKKEEK